MYQGPPLKPAGDKILGKAVVRVELTPNPALPPGTDLVRYYRMRYSEITGWTHRGRANVLNWYLAAF